MHGKRKLGNGKNLSWVISALLFIFVLAGCDDGGGDGDGGDGGNGVTGNGLNVEILDASISPPATVTFRLTDADGNPIDRTEIDREDVSVNLVIARIEPGQDEYIDYITQINESDLPTSFAPSAIQASSESFANNPDNFEDLGNGMFKYTFSTPIPDDFSRNATHTVGIYATRNFGSLRYVSNDTFDFIPAGGNVSTVRDIVRTKACNTCHNPLEAHGGARRDVKLCILCHTSQIADPATGGLVDHIDPGSGNNIGFKTMVHKIHRGEDLPSVQGTLVPTPTPYFFEAFMNQPLDFSTVVFPQDIRNCTKCHTDEATQSDEYMTDPSRAACGSCHDNVDFSGNDPNRQKEHLIQTTDNNCSGCHLPSGEEFTLSVTGAHTVPLKSRSLPGVNFTILSVKSLETGLNIVRPGQHPVVTFSIKNDAGTVINPADMDALRLNLSGPTTDYSIQDYNRDEDTTGTPNGEEYFHLEDLKVEGVNIQPVGSDFAYAFATPIPPNATGTYTIGIEGYKEAIVGGGPNQVLVEEVRDAGMNEIFYFPVTNQPVTQRRMVVDNELCSDCHGTFGEDFSVHGNNRNYVQYCVLCHNPSADDLAVRPVDDPENESDDPTTETTESIDFKVMIHKIHTGEDLTDEEYIIYGFRGSRNDFAEVRYPGNRSDCEACHLPDTNLLLNTDNNGLQPGVLPSTERMFTLDGMENNVVTNIFTTTPVVAVCTSCHDQLVISDSNGDGIFDGITGESRDPDKDAHVAGPRLESQCDDCHIAGMTEGVDRAHIPPLPPEERIVRPQPVEE